MAFISSPFFVLNKQVAHLGDPHGGNYFEKAWSMYGLPNHFEKTKRGILQTHFVNK